MPKVVLGKVNATINGVSSLNIVEGDGIKLEQDGSTLKISYSGSSGGQAEIIVDGILIGDGTGNVSAAVPGVDYGYPAIVGETPPTTNTEGSVGQLYIELSSSPKAYVCASDTDGVYTWKELTSSGSGTPGADGITPHIGDNGNWFVGDVDTGVHAEGAKGDDGVTPHIDETSGNWFIGDTDTGILAKGQTSTTIETIALLASGWTGNEQTVSCNGISADVTSQTVTIAADTHSKMAYANAGITCTGFDTNSLTFTADFVPNADLVVYVAIEKAGDSVANNIYSTEETIVGAWIDGKPIYRRACFTSLDLQAINQWVVAGIAIDDIDRCIHGSVLTEYGENSLIIIGNNVTTNQGIEVYTTTSTGPIFCIILEYTKTTDTATIEIPSATALNEAYEEGVNEA